MKGSEVKLEGRAATIHDVTVILNEILEQVVRNAKPMYVILGRRYISLIINPFSFIFFLCV